jgi:heat shock protein HslJ
MLTRVAFAVGLFAILASAAGCSSSGGTVGLVNRDFLSVSVTENGAARPLVPGTRVRLHFGSSDLGASAGCNSIGGTYRVEAGRLLFDAGGMTAIGCDPDRNAQDAWLTTLLASKPLIRFGGADLAIDNGTTTVNLVDREVAEPDLNIVGPTWTLDSIIAGDAVSSVPAGARATLFFKNDGTVDVFAGCNQGSATWTASGAGITFGSLALTKRACPDPGASIESAVVSTLGQGAVTAKVEASLLTLRAGANGLVFRGG